MSLCFTTHGNWIHTKKEIRSFAPYQMCKKYYFFNLQFHLGQVILLENTMMSSNQRSVLNMVTLLFTLKYYNSF